MKAELATGNKNGRSPESGRSIIETLIVIAIASVLAALALPQLISSRRLIRSAALPREIVAQLRFTRQQAMSQRQAFTFQYDNSTKQIKIFDHNNSNNANAACNISGTAVLTAANYPSTACSVNVLTVPLGGTGGLAASEITFGVPTGITNTTLGDNTTPTALSGSVLNITFQADGTVVDSNGNLTSKTLFLYNSQVPQQTAVAISVLGGAGRVKAWRYDASASKFAE